MIEIHSESYRGQGVLYTLKLWRWVFRFVRWYEYWKPEDTVWPDQEDGKEQR